MNVNISWVCHFKQPQKKIISNDEIHPLDFGNRIVVAKKINITKDIMKGPLFRYLLIVDTDCCRKAFNKNSSCIEEFLTKNIPIYVSSWE